MSLIGCISKKWACKHVCKSGDNCVVSSNYLDDDAVKLRLESLPLFSSSDAISYYFENVGENVKVLSVVMEGDNKATVVLSGLTDSGKRKEVTESCALHIYNLCTFHMGTRLCSYSGLKSGHK